MNKNLYIIFLIISGLFLLPSCKKDANRKQNKSARIQTTSDDESATETSLAGSVGPETLEAIAAKKN